MVVWLLLLFRYALVVVRSLLFVVDCRRVGRSLRFVVVVCCCAFVFVRYFVVVIVAVVRLCVCKKCWCTLYIVGWYGWLMLRVVVVRCCRLLIVVVLRVPFHVCCGLFLVACGVFIGVGWCCCVGLFVATVFGLFVVLLCDLLLWCVGFGVLALCCNCLLSLIVVGCCWLVLLVLTCSSLTLFDCWCWLFAVVVV